MAKNKLTIEDHPRLCGEKLRGTNIAKQLSGSPPPMRGKGIPEYHRAFQAGITPAYAGKRTPQNPKNPVRRDHPRLCGEKFDAPS